MRLAFCVITIGDEELDKIKTLIDSTKAVFDGVFITTNGREFQKTKEYCEKNDFKHSHLAWNDNSAEQRGPLRTRNHTRQRGGPTRRAGRGLRDARPRRPNGEATLPAGRIRTIRKDTTRLTPHGVLDREHSQ